jgi:hypothetical protein
MDKQFSIAVILATVVGIAHGFHQIATTLKFRGGGFAPQATTDVRWESTKALDSIPDTLVRSIDGNASMRRKFEEAVRNAQVS